jgi:hypothetical protein
MFARLRRYSWFHFTRALSVILIAYALVIEDDPGTRGTMVTAAIGIIAVEPVARREKVAQKD